MGGTTFVALTKIAWIYFGLRPLFIPPCEYVSQIRKNFSGMSP